MKRLLISGLLAVMTIWAYGQKKTTYDQSYSIRNYKHFNKVSIARANDLDKVVSLRPIVVAGGPEYKHRFNQSGLVVRSAFRTLPVKQSRGTAKHPLGL
jgi:hypothetical protein